MSFTSKGQKKVVLITGCSTGGIGHALALAFHSSGRYLVFATARNVSKMDTLPKEVERVALDVTDQSSVDKAVEQVIEKAGKIDILINNAGGDFGLFPLVETPSSSFFETYDVNLFGTLRMTQAVLRHMIPAARKDRNAAGLILNISSIAGLCASLYASAYESSKAAVNALSDCLRRELAPFGIKVMVCLPGKIGTNFEKARNSSSPPLPVGSPVKELDEIVEKRRTFVGNIMEADKFAQLTLRWVEQKSNLGTGKLASEAYKFEGPYSRMFKFFSIAPSWVNVAVWRKMWMVAEMEKKVIANSQPLPKGKLTAKKVALVTGCSDGGIGSALALALYETGKYEVFASARNTNKITSLPDEIKKVQLDVTSQESVELAVKAVLDQATRIDLLINNAGREMGNGPTAEIPVKDFVTTFETNLLGVVRVSSVVAKSAMLPQAREDRRRAGRIVTVGSVVGFAPMAFNAGYDCSKVAVHRVMESLRLELEPYGIKAVIFAAGGVSTRLIDNRVDFDYQFGDDSNCSELRGCVEERISQNANAKRITARQYATEAIGWLEKHWKSPSQYHTSAPGGATMTFLSWLPLGVLDSLVKMGMKIPSKVGH